MKTRILMIILVSMFFSLKPKEYKTWVDSPTKSRKVGMCGEWVLFKKDDDLLDKLLNREQTADYFYRANNVDHTMIKKLTGGFWFIPDGDQIECRKHLQVLDGEVYWYPPITKKIRVTSRVGTRFLHRKENVHLGVDIHTSIGTRVHSMNAGTVVGSLWHDALGNFIVIENSNGVRILYAHLSRRFVDTGEKAEMGQVIGTTGNTGHSTGPHLHIEMKVGNAYVDALSMIK